MLHGDPDDDLMDFNLPQFKEANGFIMMVDPRLWRASITIFRNSILEEEALNSWMRLLGQ